MNKKSLAKVGVLLFLLSMVSFSAYYFYSLPETSAPEIPTSSSSKIISSIPETRNIIIDRQDGLDSYITWKFTEINSTTWEVNFSVRQEIIDAINNCRSLPAVSRPACYSNLRNTYFSNYSFVDFLSDVGNIVNYPLLNLSKGMKFDRNALSYLQDRSFYITFEDGFKSGLSAKFGFGSTIINTTTDSSPFQNPVRVICRTTNLLHFIYKDGVKIYYRNSTDGINFRPNISLDGSSSIDDVSSFPSIACSGIDIFIVWANSTTGVFYRNSSNEGVTFSSEINNFAPVWYENPSPIRNPSVAFSNGDNIWVPFIIDAGSVTLYISNSTFYNGNLPTISLTSIVDLGASTQGFKPSITINTSNEKESILLVGKKGLDNALNAIGSAYSSENGASWDIVSSIGGANNERPSSNFLNRTFYFVAVNRSSDLYLWNNSIQSSFDGSDVKISTITDNSNTSNPSIAIDKNSGNIYIFWSQNDTTNNRNWDIKYRKWNISSGWDSVVNWQNLNSSLDPLSNAKIDATNSKIEVIWINRTATSGNIDIMYDFIYVIDNPVTFLFRNSTNEINNNNMTNNYTTGVNITAYASSGTVSIFRNGTDISSQNNTNIFYGAGVWEIKINSTINDTGLTNYLTVRQMFPNVSVYFNGTINSNRNITNNTVINVTGLSNTSQIHPILNYSGNYTFNLRETDTINQRFENVTKFFNESNRVINITIYTDGNTNWTRGSITRYIYLDVSSPNIRGFDLNTTFITINETALLTINTTDDFTNISKVLIEIQSSGGKNNRTAIYDSSTGNYTFSLNKTWLGELSANASLINITKIFTNDSVNNFQVNSTSLNISYGTTTLTAGDEPDPVTNSIGQAIEIFAYYNTSESIVLTGSTCSVTTQSNTYSMIYDAISSRYEIFLGTNGLSVGAYSYNMTCTNSSYQTQTGSGSYEVVTGLGGGSGASTGGGGGGSTITCKSEANVCERDSECCGGMLCLSNACKKVQILPRNFTFSIYPRLIEPNPISEEKLKNQTTGLYAIQDVIRINNKETNPDAILYPEYLFVSPNISLSMSSWCKFKVGKNDSVPAGTERAFELNCLVPLNVSSGVYETTLLIWARGYDRDLAKDVRISFEVGGKEEAWYEFITGSIAPTPIKNFFENVKDFFNYNIFCFDRRCSENTIFGPYFVDNDTVKNLIFINRIPIWVIALIIILSVLGLIFKPWSH